MNGTGAILVGLDRLVIVWFAWNYLSKVRPFSKVDDALGVVYTHGFAGLTGGLLVGILADPHMIEYGVAGNVLRGRGRLLGRRLVLRPLLPPALGAVPRRAVGHLAGRPSVTAIIFYIREVHRGPARIRRGPRDW